MVAAKFAITPEDYMEYYLYMTWDAPDRKQARLKYYGRQVLVNGGIILVLFYTQLFRLDSLMLYIYVGILALITILQIFNGRILARKQGEKITKDEDNASLFVETMFDISEAGITRKDVNIETRYHWNAFVRKEETAQYYFLFISSIQAIIFPKRVFKSAEDKMQFEKLLSQHLSFDAEVGHLMK
ncbi:MAG TPA: YcxB family protein [Ferruginibacter sp.]|nr:YcxB family protein [Ferruginibacter sp.]